MIDSVYQRQLGYSAPIHWIWIVIASVLVFYFFVRIYRSERGNSPAHVRLLLCILRSVVTLLVLMSALDWHFINKRYRKPEIYLVFDDSMSLQHLDEIQDLETVLDQMEELGLGKPTRANLLKSELLANSQALEWLNRRYELKLFKVGESIQPFDFEGIDELLGSLEFNDGQSRIDHSLSQLLKESVGQKPDAIVVFSDGLDSDDSRFRKSLRLGKALGVPIIPVGLGSREPVNDVAIVDVNASRKVFLNDQVEFQISLTANGFGNRQSRIKIVDPEENETLIDQEIKFTSNRFRDQLRFRVRMNHEGKRAFQIRVLPLSDELETRNNETEFTVEVKGDQIKVLLASNYPSREFHYLKQFLGRSSKPHQDSPQEFARNRIQLTTFLQQADIEYAGVDRHATKLFPVTRNQLFEFDVVIFCDMKPNWAGDVAGGLGQNELTHLKDFVEEHGGGLVLIAGEKYSPKAYALSPIATLFPFEFGNLQSPQQTVLDQPFVLRRTIMGKRFLPMELGADSEFKNYHEFPGTYWYSTSKDLRASARVLARLDHDGQSLPAIVLQTIGNGSVLYHAFPETYRWRYRTNEVYFGRYWSQMIQYLAAAKLTRGDKAISLETDRRIYFRQEPVTVFARLSNQSKSLKGSVSATIQSDSGLKRSITIQESSESRSHAATVEDLSPGSYRVYLNSDREVYTEFEISNSSRENERQPVNEANLKRLAEETGGTYLEVTEIDEIDSSLPTRELIEIGGEPPWVFWQHWEFKSIFGGVLLLLLSFEWVVRKRSSML